MFPIIRTNKKKEGVPEKIGEVEVKISCVFEKSRQSLTKQPKTQTQTREIRGKCKNYIKK